MTATRPLLGICRHIGPLRFSRFPIAATWWGTTTTLLSLSSPRFNSRKREKNDLKVVGWQTAIVGWAGAAMAPRTRCTSGAQRACRFSTLFLSQFGWCIPTWNGWTFVVPVQKYIWYFAPNKQMCPLILPINRLSSGTNLPVIIPSTVRKKWYVKCYFSEISDWKNSVRFFTEFLTFFIIYIKCSFWERFN